MWGEIDYMQVTVLGYMNQISTLEQQDQLRHILLITHRDSLCEVRNYQVLNP